MSPPEQDDGDEAPSPLLAVLRNPADGKHRLPYLLSLLDEDAVQTRIRASCALCLVVEQFPDMLEYVVGRLVDRLDDEDVPTEVLHTLDYLAAEDPKAVDDVLVELEEQAEVRARERMYRTGGYARNDYFTRTEPGGDVGHTRARRPTGGGDDPRRAYEADQQSGTRTGANDDSGENDDSGDSPGESDEFVGETDDGTAGTSGDRTGTVDEKTAAGDGRTGTEYGETAAEDDVGGSSIEAVTEGPLTRGQRSVLSDKLSTVIANSRFDSLDVLAARRRRRYADVYRTLGTIAGEEQAVGLMVFHLPGDGSRSEFVERFRDRMQSWADGDDHENVHTVYDWGWQPRPWAAVEYAGHRLADRNEFSVRGALATGRRLAAALAHLHQRGVVHGGIDPQNVAYLGNALGGDGEQLPFVTNVELLHCYRWSFDPVEFLDPRYAAPEYFDRGFGKVDHLTDIYQFGMVLYRLFTGRPPFAGQFETVRDRAVDHDPRPPSQVNGDVPPAVDQIVAKATAKRKLSRYESVTHLQQELCSLDAGSNSNGT